MECLPIVQDDFPPDYKSVRDMLRTKIQTCNAVVHLAGFYYGAEPQPVIPGPDRRSFTQMEYEIAMELKLPCYVFLCGKDFPFDKHDPEPEDKQKLQLDHRERLLKRDELFYEFASPEELANRTRELQLSVEGLRKELVKERGRRRLAMIAAASALVIAVVGGTFLLGRQQEQAKVIASTNEKLEKQGELIAQLLAEQDRLRKASAGAGPEIVKQAEINVAKATNQSVADVQRGVQEAIAAAEKDVAAAKAGSGNLADALQRLADAQLAAGHVNESINALQQRFALLDREKDPVQWAQSANILAMALYDRDVMSIEPEKILRDAFNFAKKNPKLGPENPATLDVMTSLARCILVSSPDEAIALDRAALKAHQAKLGPDDPKTLGAMLVLARGLNATSHNREDAAATAESLALFQKVLATNETKLGPDNPETLWNALDLASFYSGQKKFAEAEVLYRRVLQAREKALGPDATDTLNPVRMLAFLREDQKDYPGAIEYARRAAAGSERTLGPDDKETLSCQRGLAGLLQRSKVPANIAEAEGLYRKTLEAYLRTVGPGQPDTLEAYDSLITLLGKEGKAEEAKTLNLQRLSEQGKAVGTDDVGYAVELFIAASQYFVADDYATAKPLAEQCLKIRETKLGAENTDTLDTLDLLISTTAALGDNDQAEALARRALAARLKQSPPDQLAIANSYNRLAQALSNLKRKAEALQVEQKAAKIASDSLPADDITRKAIEKNLADLEAAVPSFEAFAEFRKEIQEKSEGNAWKQTKADLPGNEGERRHYVKGWSDDEGLQKLMLVDAAGDKDGTYKFYYWLNGKVASVFEVREGPATGLSGVKKTTETYNFVNERLVGWESTKDGKEAIAYPSDPSFAAAGKRIVAESAVAAAALEKGSASE